jgi:polar amino acid transport system ATP-binding protein
MNLIEVNNLNKSFGDLHVLKDINFAVKPDEVVTLVGPSGSGKSTLLRCLNLMERPEAGELSWRGEPVPYQSMTPGQLSSHRARMGMVFQHFHLFPHMKVIDNVIAGPVNVLQTPRKQALEKGYELLERVGLSDKAGAWPAQLSGGQKQRVAIARALAMDPEALLLDEVTSALDVELIAGVNELLANLADEGMTMVVVTHDLNFARKVSKRVCFMDEGRIVEEGETAQVLDDPQQERARDFMAAVTG